MPDAPASLSAAAGPSILAVVVTHQSASTIDDCLLRLRQAVGVSEIRVVDNLSTDDTLEIVQRHALADPRVRFIANPGNPGFSVACNQGARSAAAAATAPGWLAFVNPDCLVQPDTLSRALALGAPLGDVLVGVDLVDEQGSRDAAARRREPDFGAMLRGWSRAGAAAARLGVAPDDAVELQRVDAVSGALMLMPAALFERLGGFDERYRLHAEDLDLCRRARDAGAVVAVANRLRVVHVRGVSGRRRPLFVEWHKHRGLARYFDTFEASRHGILTRVGVRCAIWSRFLGMAVGKLLTGRGDRT
ncbi:MAG: glycosyltransferase family 2 protein [Pseudomonadota bacterium]|nr:glycosyltransferase family 2 protein [Pseudomonadota bacterium]